MTTVSLGKVAFTWKGSYDASTTYNSQDVVEYNGDSFVCVTDNTSGTAPTSTSSTTSPTTSNLTVTVQQYYGSNYFYIDGVKTPTLQLYEGNTYIFDVSDSSLSNHPLKFSETSNGTHNSGTEYTTGVTSSGTAGSAGATVTIVVASNAPLLYYYCGNHSGMGGTANTPSYATSTTTTSNWNLLAQGSLGVGQNSGDLIYFDGTQLQRLPTGNANQVLKIDGTTQLPVWGDTNYRSGVKGKFLWNFSAQSYRRNFCVMEDGSMRGWGTNSYGTLGDGTTTTRYAPVTPAFDNSNNFTGIKLESDGTIRDGVIKSTYYNMHIIGNNGHLYNWGYNGYSHIGDGTSTDRYTPYDATADSANSLNGKEAYEIAQTVNSQSYNSTMVLCTDGTLHGCGYNGYGQLGNSSTTNSNRFGAVSQTALKFWRIFGSGDRYTSYIGLGAVYGDALVGGGTVGSTTDILTETPVTFRVYFWGYAGDYQNGFNTNTNYSVPTEITTFYTNTNNIIKCVPTRHSWFALSDNGTLYGWGYPYGGHLGNGTTSTTQAVTQIETNVAEIVASKSSNGNTCAWFRKTNGEVYASGYNGYGQLGVGDQTARSTFTQSATAPTNITKMVVSGGANYDSVMALTSDNEVYGVGYNGVGNLGIGNTTNQSTWQKAKFQKPIVDLCAIGHNTSENGYTIITDDGGVYATGYGNSGQTGDYSGNSQSTFQPIVF